MSENINRPEEMEESFFCRSIVYSSDSVSVNEPKQRRSLPLSGNNRKIRRMLLRIGRQCAIYRLNGKIVFLKRKI